MWEDVEALAWSPPESGHHNLFSECCGRWASDGGRVALSIYSESGEVQRLSHATLDAMTSRFASFLRDELGLRAGDRVAGVLGRTMWPWLTALASWRIGAIYVPLFAGYGIQALADRVELADPRLVVADGASADMVTMVQAAVGRDVTVAFTTPAAGAGGYVTLDAVKEHPALEEVADTRPDDPAIVIFTSGTSGPPKMCSLPHSGWLATVPFLTKVLGLQDGDTILSLGDPGWSYGLLTTGFAAMALGAGVTVPSGRFDPDVVLDAADAVCATHIAGPPTAFRSLVERLPARQPPRCLRIATSGGEPLDHASAAAWTEQTGTPLIDGFGLTEVGMVLAGSDDGSATGFAPVPGWQIRLVDPHGCRGDVARDGVLAVRRPRYQLATGYLNSATSWNRHWVDGEWFVTDDVFRREPEGGLTYRGRADDVIVTSGYNVSPAEIEAAIRKHGAVADVAVVGLPDPHRGQVVRAVVLRRDKDRNGEDALRNEIQSLVREQVGRHAYPRVVDFVDALPRTASGKVVRGQLRISGPPPGPGPPAPHRVSTS